MVFGYDVCDGFSQISYWVVCQCNLLAAMVDV